MYHTPFIIQNKQEKVLEIKKKIHEKMFGEKQIVCRYLVHSFKISKAKIVYFYQLKELYPCVIIRNTYLVNQI